MKKNRIIAIFAGYSTACMWMSADIKKQPMKRKKRLSQKRIQLRQKKNAYQGKLDLITPVKI